MSSGRNLIESNTTLTMWIWLVIPCKTQKLTLAAKRSVNDGFWWPEGAPQTKALDKCLEQGVLKKSCPQRSHRLSMVIMYAEITTSNQDRTVISQEEDPTKPDRKAVPNIETFEHLGNGHERLMFSDFQQDLLLFLSLLPLQPLFFAHTNTTRWIWRKP